MLTVKSPLSQIEDRLEHAASRKRTVQPGSVSQSHISERTAGKAGAKTTASNSSPESKELAARAKLIAMLVPAGMECATRIAHRLRRFESS